MLDKDLLDFYLSLLSTDEEKEIFSLILNPENTEEDIIEILLTSKPGANDD